MTGADSQDAFRRDEADDEQVSASKPPAGAPETDEPAGAASSGYRDAWRPGIAAAGLIGAALFIGHAMITPALSVLSAVEGLKLVTPALSGYDDARERGGDYGEVGEGDERGPLPLTAGEGAGARVAAAGRVGPRTEGEEGGARLH